MVFHGKYEKDMNNYNSPILPETVNTRVYKMPFNSTFRCDIKLLSMAPAVDNIISLAQPSHFSPISLGLDR